MQSSILYSRCTTLPGIRGHFRRPRIDELFAGLLDRHLIAVTAGAGSGKTHAVSAFLHNAGVRVFWLQLSALDNNLTRFWEEFIYVIEFQNVETAAALKHLGFPETLLKFDKFLHILARDIYSHEQVVFVFDDFHLIHDESILRFIQNLILARLENFCIIINSRVNLNYNLAGLFLSGLAGHVTAEDLYFTREETVEYLRHLDAELPARRMKKLHIITGGWPLALYLVGLSIKKGGVVSKDPIAGAIPLIFEMIEKELFSEYTPEMQNFLIRASLLDSFPASLIKSLAGDYFDDALELINNNTFIYLNQYTGHYCFHHLFLDFLCGKQEYLTKQEMTETYLTAAEWCAANDMKIEALTYYDKCGCHNEILDIILNFGVAVFTKAIASLYINLMDRFPAEIMERNPLLHVHHAGLLYNNAEVEQAKTELLEIQRKLETPPVTEQAEGALGEIHCMLGIISLGMADYSFTEQFKKAEEYLPGGSVMIDNKGTAVNTRYAIMLSSPAPGELERMENAMFTAMPRASAVMRGYGQGMDFLASAEAAYFTGDMKKAYKNAYNAVYMAREKHVADVVFSGYFLLMRIEAANGNYNGVISNFEQIKAYADEAENKWNFNGMPDVADGWFNLTLGNAGQLAGWLVDDAIGSDTLAPYSMGMERSIKARYLLREGKYYELLAWLGQAEKPIRQYNILLILLDILICKAIALHRINDEKEALIALREAYEIAHGNKLIMQFVELGNDIRAVIYCARNSKDNTIPDSWLGEIYTKAATYEKHLRNIRSLNNQISGLAVMPPVKVTKRERELLGYLCQGLTNAEIAAACFITVSAVKKSLNSIYIKLGAANRAEAVRTAIQMGLNN